MVSGSVWSLPRRQRNGPERLGNRLDRILGFERAESDALLDELAAEARKPRHHFAHQWTVGDCVVWDNRATMHRVDVDYPMGERRIMQRVLIEGDKPF